MTVQTTAIPKLELGTKKKRSFRTRETASSCSTPFRLCAG